MQYRQILFLSVLLWSCADQTAKKTDSGFEAFMEIFDPGNSRAPSDLSEAHYESRLSSMKEQLYQLGSIDTSLLSFEENIDIQFAKSILEGKALRLGKHQSWKKDPRNYMQFRGLANAIGKPGSIEEKIKEVEERLKLVPVQLINGQKQLDLYIPRFQELGLFMANNARSLFQKEVPQFIEANDLESQLSSLNDEASEALENYIIYLRDELPKLPEASFAMGKAVYNEMLTKELLLDYTDETLWDFGNEQFNKTVSELEEVAREIDPSKTWQELAVEIKNDYPDPYEMIEAHQLWVDSAKSHILANNLMPIPWPERVNVVPRAEYLRKTSYYGNFSRARGKDEEGIFTAEWMINPFEDQWDEQTKNEYLVEHDWGVIIVTAPHEAYGGHHVQGLYQMHNPRKIRRENGLSLFSEGWGLYNEQLMRETGFFPNKRILLRQLQLRLWRNARVIYDVGIHTGKMTYEEAISLMTDRVGFLRWAAQLEVDAASQRPGYFIGYFMGMTEILKMRELYKAKMADQFNLSDFHERLMKIGNMPPKLMEVSLMKD